MKVALFLPSLHGGGAERVFINLARALKPLVSSVDLLVASFEGEYAREVDDINVIDLGVSRVANSIWPLTGYLRKKKPDILLSAMPHANLASVIAAKLASSGVRVIVSVHEDVLQRLRIASIKDYFMLYATKFGYRFANGIIGVSSGSLESERIFLGKSFPFLNCVIFNPILNKSDVISPLRIIGKNYEENKVLIIATAGRLSYEKDHKTLIRAFAQLCTERNCILIIYGEGPMREDLETLVLELGISKKVSFPGFESNLRDKLRQVDIFVLSSRWEGFGNVLVEAISSGCNIVSTDCPNGPREILAGGRYGLLSPVCDSTALAYSIGLAIDGQGPVFDTSQFVKPYISDVVATEYVNFFKKCYDAKSNLYIK
jgi:glycosyltransferase involved in cell wall biosynthesis